MKGAVERGSPPGPAHWLKELRGKAQVGGEMGTRCTYTERLGRGLLVSSRGGGYVCFSGQFAEGSSTGTSMYSRSNTSSGWAVIG